MKLKFSKIELRALRKLSAGEATVGGLAAELGAKQSFISRVVGRLGEKGLVATERRGTARIVRLSPASHAQKFKQLSDSRPESKIESWLSGSAIDALIVMGDGVESSLLFYEAGCSRATLYKVLGKLGSAGAIGKRRGRVWISDVLVKGFASAFADNLQLILEREAKGLNTSIRVRKHVVLRTDAASVPGFFSLSGISALAKKGLEANPTSYQDFYFNLDQKKRSLGVEECFIHALLLSTLQHQDLPVLSVFFAKNAGKLDLPGLKKLASTYLVEDAFEELRQKTEFYEKMRELA
ncbi:Sugar-specific transcriptional regulator TrmB [uncultured archaeon]|nr:Sugar-specific transcriptional regulator TrmB [uncultured archaeon]